MCPFFHRSSSNSSECRETLSTFLEIFRNLQKCLEFGCGSHRKYMFLTMLYPPTPTHRNTTHPPLVKSTAQNVANVTRNIYVIARRLLGTNGASCRKVEKKMKDLSEKQARTKGSWAQDPTRRKKIRRSVGNRKP